jgi:hypothetical protein
VFPDRWRCRRVWTGSSVISDCGSTSVERSGSAICFILPDRYQWKPIEYQADAPAITDEAAICHPDAGSNFERACAAPGNGHQNRER